MSPHSSPSRSVRRAVGRALVAVLVVAGILGPPPSFGHAVTGPTADAGSADGRTWVVDAVDDMYGNRWESVDTGTSEVTIEVGDTVEWQFDIGTAAIEHDLTSLDTGATWEPAIAAYRVPGDPPVRHTFTEPGVYHYICSLHGTVMHGTVVVGEGDGDPPPPPPPPPPAVAATASPSSGAAPLPVRFGVTVHGAAATAGEFAPFADGVATYPDLAGTGELVRSAAGTSASLDVTGLRPNAHHMVHVHEQACSVANGGAHFRFDETQPFAEQNEIWLPFTSDDQGRSGLVAVTKPQRAGPKAVSIVIHDPENPAKRIGCVDLMPSGLSYSWDFGDGTTGAGVDPAHTYTEPGAYTATVAVHDPHADHGTGHHATASDSVDITVGEDVPPETQIVRGPVGTVRSPDATFRFNSSERGSRFECRLDQGDWQDCASGVDLLGLDDGRHRFSVRATDRSGRTDDTPAARGWTVDTTGPEIGSVGPSGATSNRTPTIRVDLTDLHSAIRRRDQALYVDGREVGGVEYIDRRDRLLWTPRRPLAVGAHTFRLVAMDGAGNRARATWRLVVR